MHYRKNHLHLGRHLLSAPFIYWVLFPVLFLDLSVELYHRVCFPLYGLPYIQRSKYIRIDRHRLSYLRWYEKINCAYCGYVNGFFFYVSAIAAATENYWCGIKHEKRSSEFLSPSYHSTFLEYGDEQSYSEFVAS